VATTTPEKFQLLRKQVGSEVIQRDDEIDIALWSLLAQVGVFLLGSPGVAKSLLLERVRIYIDGMRLFRKLLTASTTTPELFGPYDVSGLKDGHMRLITRGKLPEANVALIDETFKATSSLLNSLLMAMNERLFEDDGVERTMPLSSMWGASNELPDDPFLLAFFDRFLFRREVTPLQDWADKRALLDLDIDPNPAPILTWAEVETAQAEVKRVVVADDTKEALIEVLRGLADLGITPTDRRSRECLKVVRAAAWMEGEKVAGVQHLEPLIHVLWEKPTQFGAVQKVVMRIASPGTQDALDLSDVVAEHVEELDKVIARPADNDRTTQLMEVFAKFKLDMDTAKALQPRTAGRGARIVDEQIAKLRVHGARVFEAQGIKSMQPFD
jgi:MoxR-like ATPase